MQVEILREFIPIGRRNQPGSSAEQAPKFGGSISEQRTQVERKAQIVRT